MEWLEKEEAEIAYLKSRKSYREEEREQNRMLFIMLGIFAFVAFTFMFNTDPLQAYEERFFPDTWNCKKCGYENYEGIFTCGVCGTAK